MSNRALQIIQDEEYLEDIDFDEIKEQNQESSFFANYTQTDFNKKKSVLLKAFRTTLEENQVLKPDKKIVSRVKRQILYSNLTGPCNIAANYATPSYFTDSCGWCAKIYQHGHHINNIWQNQEGWVETIGEVDKNLIYNDAASSAQVNSDCGCTLKANHS